MNVFMLISILLTSVAGDPNPQGDLNDASGVEVVTELGPMFHDVKAIFKSHTSPQLKDDSKSARLPTSLLPSHYIIRLQPFINGNLSIHGSVDITIQVAEATDQVVINMVDIISINDTVSIKNLNDSTKLQVIQQTYDPSVQMYTALLSGDLLKGNSYVFHMDFQGYLNDKLVGLYRSQYTDAQGRDRLLAATQFSPTDARRAFPSFDEPGFKATFDVHLARQSNMTALSNMPLISTVPIEGEEGWVWDSFNTTLRMSTYLVGFLISDFGSVTSTELNHTLYKVWSRDDALDQAIYARDTAPPILTFLEDYFGIEFPLPKLDMAAIPDFKFNGMENWGLILYRETALLYDPQLSSTKSKQNLGYVLAHEIAHQWFGNLVTPIWWSDLWLKEGFASFMGYIGLDSAEPTWDLMEQFVVDYVQPVLAVDSLQSSHPINVEVNHPDEISEIFDFISYRKGASIIRMMQHFLGESTYRRGLTNYLNGLAFDNAEQDDLWRYMTEIAHEDSSLPKELSVKLIMDTWTLQEGYPVVTVSRQGTTATLTQEWFKLGGQTSMQLGWWIPITYTSQTNPNFNNTQTQQWMSKDRKPLKITDIPDTSNWIVVNVQETGYYRVNYDISTWRLLSNQLNSNHSVIHLTNRAQILDDSFNLARAGRLDYPTTLAATKYLVKERRFVPWSSALMNFNYLKYMFERTAVYGTFRDYLLSLVLPLYNSVGFEDHENDHHLLRYKRVIAVSWACKLGHPSCIDKSKALFQRWVTAGTNESVMSPNVQGTVLCTAISSGGEKEWNAAWDRYTKSNVGTERTDILSALGCTREIWILSRYLDMSFKPGSGIRKQDASLVFGAVSKNTVGRDLAWNYLQDKWLHILEYFGSGSGHLTKVIKAATKTFNTPLEVKELEKFQSDYDGKLGSAVRTVKQSLESARLNVAWMNSYYKVILQWLNDQGFTSEI